MSIDSQIEVTHWNGVTLLTPAADGTHSDFAELLDLAAESTSRLLVVDLRHVEHLHTTAALRLLELRQFARRHGVQLRVCNLQEHAQKTLTITRIRPLFEIHETEHAALVA